MTPCSVCGGTFARKQSEYGIFWACEGCQNWLISMAILRRTVEPSFFNDLWQKVRCIGQAKGTTCPLCSKAMGQIFMESSPDPLVFQICQGCNVALMAPHERAALPLRQAPEPVKPEPEAPKNELSQEAIQMMAIHQVELIGERAKQERMFDASHLPFWQKFLAAIGFPVEDDPGSAETVPWCTILLTLVTTGFSIACFRNHSIYREAVEEYGFIPARIDAQYGWTFLSSFFVHGGWFHLISNMYCLFIFGRAVEAKIHWHGLLTLIVLSTLGGNLFTLFFEPTSDIPHIGASGGIAGVLLFYGFVFPKKKLVFSMGGYVTGAILIRFPALAVLALWVGVQIFGAAVHQPGQGGVSYSSHLGGLLTGLVFWALWRWKTMGGFIKVEG